MGVGGEIIVAVTEFSGGGDVVVEEQGVLEGTDCVVPSEGSTSVVDLSVEDGSISVTSFSILSVEELGVDGVEGKIVIIESSLEINLAEEVEEGSVEEGDTSLVEKEMGIRGVEEAFHGGEEGGVQGLEQGSIVSSVGS